MNLGQIPFYLVGQTLNVALESIGPVAARLRGKENAAYNLQVVGNFAENILAGISATKIAQVVAPKIGAKSAIGVGVGVGLALCGLSFYETKDAEKSTRRRIAASIIAKALNTVGVVQTVAARGFNSMQSKLIGAGFFVASLLNTIHSNYSNESIEHPETAD